MRHGTPPDVVFKLDVNIPDALFQDAEVFPRRELFFHYLRFGSRILVERRRDTRDVVMHIPECIYLSDVVIPLCFIRIERHPYLRLLGQVAI